MDKLDQLEQKIDALKEEIGTLERQLADTRKLLQQINQEYEDAVIRGDEKGKKQLGGKVESEEAKLDELRSRFESTKQDLGKIREEHVLAQIGRMSPQEREALKRAVEEMINRSAEDGD